MIMTRGRTAKSQFGYQTAPTGQTYQVGGPDINFANGQMIFLRFPTNLRRNVTINSATIKLYMTVKNGNTTQQSSNRIFGHYSGDSPMLMPGLNEWTRRSATSSFVDWNPMWVAGSTGDVFDTVNIKPILDQIVAKSDFAPGGYITLMIQCIDEKDSDMGIRANNDFAPSAQVTVDYNEPQTDERLTINMCENSEFGTAIQAIDDDPNPLPFWQQNEAYGAFVPPENQATLAIDTSFTRVPGIPTMRVTTGTPHAEPWRKTGPIYGLNDNVNQSTVFCGWLYVAPNVPVESEMYAYDIYSGGSVGRIDARGVWVPFCSNPIVRPNEELGTWWFTVCMQNFQAGYQYWISEPTILHSTFRQMPFNGLTPDKDPGINHISTVGGMQSARLWTPRRVAKLDGITPRAYPSWRKRNDGILQLAEPIRGVGNYVPTATINSLAGTIDGLSGSINDL